MSGTAREWSGGGAVDDCGPEEVIRAVASREAGLTGLGDAELGARARGLARRCAGGRGEGDGPLIEGFALAREAGRRALGLRLYDEQLAGALAMHRGRVAEMATGEGKTLAAVPTAFLAALAGRGAHVLTFNDYLARRDAAWMDPVYRLLGVEVGVVQEGMGPAERRRAYGCQITYLTAKEAGFDLLRDGLCHDPADQVHRPFHFALVDELDSILIDEARIPLVIAGAVDADPSHAPALAEMARGLRPGRDFDTDQRQRNLFLTEAGTERVEEVLGVTGLFGGDRRDLLAAVRNAIHAEHLLRRDVHYIVRGGRVELVDELTGRVAEKRHWPDGLHAAVEAKEGLVLGEEGRILGSITLQHLLRLYPEVCGMTATATAAAAELERAYGLGVEVVPPHRPCIREDLPDLVFTHDEARDRALVEEIASAHGDGRPVLVGTASVAESERLARTLDERGIPCQALNAKNDEREAEVVARAGAPGAVTISTNMAGRGTDIRLGGPDGRRRQEVLARGGLLVLGTHRHESVRIDRQLRGRAGRQGDPGSSRFFVSLEDDLLRRCGIEKLIPRRFVPERIDVPIESAVVRREVERAQRIIDGECADARKRLAEYADILEDQRRAVAAWRQEVLVGDASLDLLESRARARWRAAAEQAGAEVLAEVERRLTLIAIDHCWSEYLTEMQEIRDEIHLVSLDGRTPLAEFYRTAIGAFDRLLERIDDQVLRRFGELEIGPDGVDWGAAGLRGPSATWTYLVSDDVFGPNVLLSMSNRASIGLWGTLVLWPVLFAWGLYQHWRKRRQRAALED